MKINADNFRVVGHGHVEIGCQDYTLSDVIGNYGFAVVCDGCSSCPKSDIGATIIAAFAAGGLKALLSLASDNPAKNNLEWFVEPAQNNFAKSIMDELLITYQDLVNNIIGMDGFTSTLFMAVVSPESYCAIGWGDGVIAEETGDGLIITSVDFPKGGTYYPLYLANQTYHEEYKKLFPGFVRQVTTDTFPTSGSDQRVTRSLDPCVPTVVTGSTSNLRTLVISSDGVRSFNDRETQKPLSYIDLKDDLFKFPSTNGMFVKRKMLSIERRSNKLYHYDDLGMAAIHVTP